MIAIIRTGLLLLVGVTCVNAQPHNNTHERERLLFDNNWRFSFGHPSDTQKDFDHATGYFSYLAKAGYGDGAADPAFDDRAWRTLDVPHDWAVEQDFSEKSSFSHGFKQVGRAFPEKSIGWYRKSFTIPAADTGRRITIAFDGVFRNAAVWINGHYLGTEPSGYTSFQYDITDYLNYGGENVLAVRADATMEEGWFYEGAGMYRHVWLQKTAPLHIAPNGVVVTNTVTGKAAQVLAGITLQNDALTRKNGVITTTLFDPAGKKVATQQQPFKSINALTARTTMLKLTVPEAQLWDLTTPRLYTLITTVVSDNKEIDRYETRFGIRTIRFDARTGFYLNGRHVTLKGTNNHQDHAGVGTAIPDALTEFRINTLKEMGSNAYRCSHHPPAPELLDACDRLGMLVIDETRLMGTTGQPLKELQKMILRDRNHPSVICWSVGNEEWRIENNETGARMALTLQAYAKSLDSTRPTTAGISGGFVSGVSDVLEVMGYNYMGNGDIEAHHRRFLNQPAMGTEEGSTFATRGIYITDSARHYMAAYDKKPRPSFYSIEEGWRFYDSRPYLAGLFIWTGFDYRGEPTPFGWPSVTSYFGMMDLCGFPKDNFYYLRSWWQDKPVLHLLPHWNWPGKEGQEIAVWAYSNCEEVELLLNGKSLGKKRMEKNGHLEWKVVYEPGVLEAVGYKNGQQLLTEKVSTTQQAAAIAMQAHKATLQANGDDVSVITVTAKDAGGRTVPVADNELSFTISGPGKIIGIGNGNPTSLEKEKYIDNIINLPVEQAERKEDTTQKTFEYTGHFELPAYSSDAVITFFYKSIGATQTIYVNGKEIATGIPLHTKGDVFVLDKQLVHAGSNTVTIKGKPIARLHDWDVINTQPGVIQVLQKADVWKRKLFNGAAQLLIQANAAPGEIKVTATGKGLANEVLSISVL